MINFSGIASYLPRNKNDDTVDSDDPTSPYSINYSGEYNNNQGYSYVIHNKDGNHTGYVSYPSQPSFKPNFTWSKGLFQFYKLTMTIIIPFY